jgi:hypothetical protein|tara:strand:- start:47 stop:541 length:495 start_codon:yes stop_codon:yes gene_type:complete
MAKKKKKKSNIKRVSQDVIRKKTRMLRSATNYGEAKDLKGNVIGDDVVTDKEIRINKPFKKNKNLYTRRVIKSRNIDGSPRKTTITKIGDKKRKTKIKNISERRLVKDYDGTIRRIKGSKEFTDTVSYKKDGKTYYKPVIKKKKKKNNLLNYLKRNINKKKKGK